MNYSTSADAPLRGASAADALNARLFGSPHLSWRGEPLHLSSQKGRALLYLLASSPEGFTRDELAELFWGPGRCANLRGALYGLRQLPGAHLWLQGGERVRAVVKSDLGAFRVAVRAGRHAEALELSAAPFLAGVQVRDAPAFEDWLEERRASLAEERTSALRGEVARLEGCGDLSGALDLTAQLIALEPLDELSYRAAMRLHYRRGDLAAASAQFAACRRVLRRELGVEPLSETLELARLIDKSRAHGLPNQSATLPLQLLRPPCLVGRDEVWAQMLEAQRSGKVIFLEGAAGVGKTRLLRDFARHLGASTFNEARPGDAHSPYSVVARGLHRFLRAHPEVQLEDSERFALARLLPQRSGGAAPFASDTPGTRLRFAEAVTSLFERMRRSVAALPTDDMHYTDSASHVLTAQVFGQLAAHSSESNRAAIIVAYRPEETPGDFEEVVTPLLESGSAVRLTLEPLTLSGVEALTESLELPGGSGLARRLHRYAGGNPMLTLETLQSTLRTGDLRAAPMLDLSLSPAGTLLRRRLEALSPLALRVARAKALSRVENVYTLAQIVELSPLAVAEGLEELQRAQVLTREHFAHDLIREAVLAHLPKTVERVLLERTTRVLTASGQVKTGSSAERERERVGQRWLGADRGVEAAPYLH